MVKEIKDRLPKRKANIFLICLVCSFMAWLVSKLSETRTDTTSFELLFSNTPDSLLQDSSQRKFVNAEVRANGFEFLRFYLGKEKLRIDLSQLQSNASGYFLPREDYRQQIDDQLPGNLQLVALEKPNLAIDFIKVHARKVPVFADVVLNLDKDHLLEGALIVEPDSVLIKGPGTEIDSIKQLRTQPVEFKNMNVDFSREVALLKPDGLKNVVFTPKKVRLSGTVFRFAEEIIEVPVLVTNLPEGTQIKTFPNTLPVLCKARIEQLKDLDVANFRVVADYGSLGQSQNELTVRLIERPEALYSAQLLKDRVEFILKRQ